MRGLPTSISISKNILFSFYIKEKEKEKEKQCHFLLFLLGKKQKQCEFDAHNITLFLSKKKNSPKTCLPQFTIAPAHSSFFSLLMSNSVLSFSLSPQ